jgi:AraC family transcriptional regulator, regulatory protein of adaptative response / DNA-3-methyladenine glycosylase II
MTSIPIANLHHAVDTRDAAYDGVFLVAITSTKIYCRPTCPSRRARRENRRFFETRAEAEESGYRACLRCRPELAQGDTPLEAVPRLARRAAAEISAGALNGRSVKALAVEFRMSERHLRRALKSQTGASPIDLATEQRLRRAIELLSQSKTSVTRIAYVSGFQSLRRFNTVFRERFQMSPSEWRRHATAATVVDSGFS